MRCFIVTAGKYSDYGIIGIAETQEKAVKLGDMVPHYVYPIEITLWENEFTLAKWELQKGGFVDGQLKLIWEQKQW